jgi:hypothetical protein
MAEFYYPPLQEGSLRALLIVKAAIQVDGEAYLEDANYSDEIVTNLRHLFLEGSRKVKRERVKNDEPLDLEAETRALYDELMNLTIEDGEGGLSIGETLSAIKTRTQLLEKLLGQLERASEVKQFGQFREMVINTLAAYLDADQRNEFMKALEAM